MKQTAVEFLVDNLHYYYSTKWNDILEQAKEMEKQQQDEFAIGFAEWIFENCNEFSKEDQELILKLYKKEKGL